VGDIRELVLARQSGCERLKLGTFDLERQATTSANEMMMVTTATQPVAALTVVRANDIDLT
jgi:hypothetical protein